MASACLARHRHTDETQGAACRLSAPRPSVPGPRPSTELLSPDGGHRSGLWSIIQSVRRPFHHDVRVVSTGTETCIPAGQTLSPRPHPPAESGRTVVTYPGPAGALLQVPQQQVVVRQGDDPLPVTRGLPHDAEGRSTR